MIAGLCSFLEALGENVSFCLFVCLFVCLFLLLLLLLFPASRSCQYALAQVLFPYLQSQQNCIILTILPQSHLPLTTTRKYYPLLKTHVMRLRSSGKSFFDPYTFLLGSPCDYIRPTQIMQDMLSILDSMTYVKPLCQVN